MSTHIHKRNASSSQTYQLRLFKNENYDKKPISVFKSTKSKTLVKKKKKLWWKCLQMALIAQLVGVGGATLVKINWTLFTSVSWSLKIPIAFDPIILRLRNSSKPTKYLLRHHETFKLIRQPGSPPCLPRGHSGGTYLLAQWLQVLFNRRPHSGPHSSLHRCPEKGFLAFLPFPLPDPPAPRV